MFYVKFEGNRAAAVMTSDEVYHANEIVELRKNGSDPAKLAALEADRKANEQALCDGIPGVPGTCTLQNRNDWDSFATVTKIAAELTDAYEGNRVFLPTDAGPSCSPRFDIVEAPKVGDKVSYAFNGDCYPDGVVTKISANYRFIYTDCGHKYLRRKQTGGWVRGGTWSLVSGHHFEQNPSF